MPVLETDRDKAAPAQAEDIAPQPAESDQAEFTSEGDLPAVAKDGPGQGASASDLAFGAQPAVDASGLDTGMHEVDEYKATCDAANLPQKWDEKYRNGHSSASQFVQPSETREAMEWHLKKGHSASDALRAFIAGPTIADYRVIAVALELDEVRDQLGDPVFDRLFGSSVSAEDGAIPLEQRLTITSAMYTTPFADQMLAIAEAKDAEAQAQPEEPAPPPVIEQREEKPRETAADQDAAVIAQEIGATEEQREIL
jgi:hypothetical protein